MINSMDFTQFCPLADFGSIVLGMLMAFLSLFLILLILVQRGRGGGLAGALGGAGGQSAFGSKAGDTFTLLTVSLAGVWIVVCAFAMWSLGMHTPAVADLIEAEVSAGPSGNDAEDIASGLVIPTTDGDSAVDSNPELVPVEVDVDSPGEMSEAAEPVDEEAVLEDKPAE